MRAGGQVGLGAEHRPVVFTLRHKRGGGGGGEADGTRREEEEEEEKRRA